MCIAHLLHQCFEIKIGISYPKTSNISSYIRAWLENVSLTFYTDYYDL